MINNGPFLGIVQANNDPMQLGRVKVSVAQVFGVSSSSMGAIGVNDLPWAMPMGTPAGGTTHSGGMDWIPEPGDQVIVFFLDGEPEKPVWAWMMQTTKQAQDTELHKYTNEMPARGAITKYSHLLEFNPQDVFLSSRSGYQVMLLNGDDGKNNGQLELNTPAGQFFILDDAVNGGRCNINEDLSFNIGRTLHSISDDVDMTTLTGDFKIISGKNFRCDTEKDVTFNTTNNWTANVDVDLKLNVTGDIKGNCTNFSITADEDITLSSTADTNLSATGNLSVTTQGEATLTSDGAMTIEASADVSLTAAGSLSLSFADLYLGDAATEPFVLGNRMVSFVNQLMSWLDQHTHSNGNNGSPTGPPINPATPQLGSLVQPMLSDVIFGV